MLHKLLLSVFFIAAIAGTASAQQYQWAKGFYGAEIEDMAVDNQGNRYLLGYVSDKADIDPGPGTLIVENTSTVSSDVYFIGKYTATGSLVWGRSLEAGSAGDKIRVDASGNIILIGTFGGTINFNLNSGAPYTLTAAWADMFIAKYNASNAALVWAKDVQSAGSVYAHDAAVDNSGNIYITGDYYDITEFSTDPGYTFLADGASGNAFTVKYTSSGSFDWGILIGDDDYGQGNVGTAITTDAAGNVYFAGRTSADGFSGVVNQIYFCRIPPTSSTADMVHNIPVHDPVYGYPGGANAEYIEHISVANNGDMYINGNFWAAMDMDGGTPVQTLTPVRTDVGNIFLAKYSSAGSYQWGKVIGGAGLTGPYAKMRLSGSQIYAWLELPAGMDIDPGTATVTATDGRLAIYNLDGTLASHKLMNIHKPGGLYELTAYGICTDADGVHAYGSFYESADFDKDLPDSSSVLVADRTNYNGLVGFVAYYNHCRANTTSIQETICRGNSYQLGSRVLTEAGSYVNKFPTGGGCDSTVVLTLSVTEVDTSVSVQDRTLTANINGASYQWIDCGTGTPVNGATQKSYTPDASGGTYKVEITAGSCVTHSGCFEIAPLGISDEKTGEGVRCYPNPVHDHLYVQLPAAWSDRPADLFLTDLSGRILQRHRYNGADGRVTLRTDMLAPGIYFLRLADETGKEVLVRFARQ